MGVTFSVSAFEDNYRKAQEKLEKTITAELSKYIEELRRELYQIMLKRSLSKSEYNKIIDKIQSSIGIHTLDVQKHIKDIYIDVLNESRLGNKDYKQSILNYETAKAVNDVTRDFFSVYNDTKQAIDHVNYVMQTQSERDKNAIWNNMKNLSREKQQEGIAAYRDLFQKDYEQRIMKELTENPLLNQLITQEDAKLYISLNGKKYDLESYISNRAKYYTTNVATQIERAVDKEQGWTIFRFVRIEDVNKERPHSIHDNEHNDDYFTTDESLVGQEYDGKILLDAYKAIEDYPYGEQPPFGCRHVWVGIAKGIEDKPEEQNEGIPKDNKKEMSAEDYIEEIKRFDWWQELKEEDAKAFEEDLKKVSVERLSLIQKYCKDMKIDFYSTEGSFYRPSENKVYISNFVKNREDSVVRGFIRRTQAALHENGHFLDHNMIKGQVLSENLSELREKVNEDVLNYVNKVLKKEDDKKLTKLEQVKRLRKPQKDEIRKTFADKFDDKGEVLHYDAASWSISDIFDGATNNCLNWNSWHKPKNGTSYWSGKYAREHEVFAEFMEIYGMNDKMAQYFKDVLPNTYAYLKETVDKLL